MHSLLFSLHSYTIFFFKIWSSFLFALFVLYFISFPTESNNTLFLAILSMKPDNKIWSNNISWSLVGKEISDNFLMFFLKLYLQRDINWFERFFNSVIFFEFILIFLFFPFRVKITKDTYVNISLKLLYAFNSLKKSLYSFLDKLSAVKSIKFSIDKIATIKMAYSSKSKLFAIINIFPNFGSTGNLAINFPISVIVVLSFLLSISSLSSSICISLSFSLLLSLFVLSIFLLLFFSIFIILFNWLIFSISGISIAPTFTRCSKDLSIKYNFGLVIKGKL